MRRHGTHHWRYTDSLLLKLCCSHGVMMSLWLVCPWCLLNQKCFYRLFGVLFIYSVWLASFFFLLMKRLTEAKFTESGAEHPQGQTDNAFSGTAPGCVASYGLLHFNLEEQTWEDKNTSDTLVFLSGCPRYYCMLVDLHFNMIHCISWAAVVADAHLYSTSANSCHYLVYWQESSSSAKTLTLSPTLSSCKHNTLHKEPVLQSYYNLFNQLLCCAHTVVMPWVQQCVGKWLELYKIYCTIRSFCI